MSVSYFFQIQYVPPSKCDCSFLFSGHSLTQFVRHCADHFLNSEHKEIRMEAARTCSRLLTPSIQLLSGHGHVSQTAVQVVADVLSKLLVVGITDPGNSRRYGTHLIPINHIK